ncbi:hypothetical protein DU000_11030 [Parvibium lacunae]|uniref:DUF2721 domain-containing protein n=1 Tax=Parvibium lacunae TaxID=1888893 RepID=A0A368L0E7_9BURK|nr:hypothetical protein DU000_11030 [Parvibium lacunae]
MNEIITELSKPVWWVSVVVAGILINLLSAYIKSKLDTIAARTFSWWRDKSQASKAAWETRIEGISENDRIRDIELAREIRFRLQSINFLLMAIFLLVLLSFVMASGVFLPKLFQLAVFGSSSILSFASFLALQNAANTANALCIADIKSQSSVKQTVEGAANR